MFTLSLSDCCLMCIFLFSLLGSNSVNVFLGLGLPWVIKTLYYQAKGKSFRVYDANLAFSVTVFLSCGVVCLLFLVLRRKVLPTFHWCIFTISINQLFSNYWYTTI